MIAVLNAFGLPTESASLDPIRQFFQAQKPEEHLSNVLRLSGISAVVMTNDPGDPNEARLWQDGFRFDARFLPALRLDGIVNDPSQRLSDLEVRRLLDAWLTRMRPVYMAVSLPDSFQFPADDRRTALLKNTVLPACRAFDIPLALMIGVRRQVNPAIGLAGDASGRADMRALEALCRDYPENRFLVTVLSRENQHELCVYARKFANLTRSAAGGF